MATIAKEDISHILSNINRKFEVQSVKWGEDSKIFDAKIRTQIPRDNDDFNALCDEWVDLFSQVTNTIWAKKTSNTGPKIRFRKLYQCWTGEGTVIKKELLFDRTRCKGSLDLKVLSDNTLSKRKSKHVRNGMNLVVKITFHHLHPVDTSKPQAFFVHNCSPQENVPISPVQPNARLQELVASMVNNGPEISRKAAEKAEKIIAKLNENNQSSSNPSNQLVVNYEGNIQQQKNVCLEVVESMTLDQVEANKLESTLTNQHFTQYVINTSPHIDITDHVLMYQPFVLDVPQIISLTSPTLPTQFLQIQPKPDVKNQGGHVL
ncbi:uncharacterized protein LOC114326995 [Diabrotica virgifera virgifera]|uniref:Uncharacterized protein n=1 Tax=Diabrotica virgifera virgifera TaxID=50390 RepID=A0ABM5IEW5_DIAVI|nr:uncharacterized protein LOC114326995 [Diabrotica virgifera virgifera]